MGARANSKRVWMRVPHVSPLGVPADRSSSVGWLRHGTGLCTLTLALTLALSGCKAVGPDYQRPTYTAPPIYKETGASTVTVPPPPDPPAAAGSQPHPPTA